MQFALFAILLLGQPGGLPSYHLTMDPVLLDSLYSDLLTDCQMPALIETEAGVCSCLAGFRGETSLGLPKKSWKIEFFDHSLINASHLLLDAQYRDLSMMRNAIGLWLTERLGRPCPRTEYVELYVNGDYYGVYLQVERIDEYFFDRVGLGDGPLFKSVSHEGRFAWQPADTSLSCGIEPKLGCEEDSHYFRRMIDRVNLGLPLNVSGEDYIAYIATTIAMYDTDALSKNYYAHILPSGEWRFYPWDRDASFGNNWNGEYDPAWTQRITTEWVQMSPLAGRLLLDEGNRAHLAGSISELSAIFENELPEVIDSIAALIRPSLDADPLKLGTIVDFDEEVAVLRTAVSDRADFLPLIRYGHQPAEVVSMELSSWELSPDRSETVIVSIEYSQPVTCIFLTYWMDDGQLVHTDMDPGDPEGTRWSREVFIPAGTDHVQFAVKAGAESPDICRTSFYYPLYGPASSPERRVAGPTARRSSTGADVGALRVLAPVRYMQWLWSLPIVNDGSQAQDLSYFGFQVGAPPSRAFAPDDLLLQPGDTLHLTNSMGALSLLLPGRAMIGDMIVDTPSGSQLTILYPSWGTAMETMVQGEVQCGECNGQLVISEISCRGGDPPGDWIELHNAGGVPLDLSGAILSDAQAHSTVLPDISVEPGGFLILCEDEDSFLAYYGADAGPTTDLGFGLAAEVDGISLLRGGALFFSVQYDSRTWPLSDDRVLFLISPGLPEEDPASWDSAPMPGSPGENNHGWPGIPSRPVMGPPVPNPVMEGFTLDYMVPFLPADFSVYDLTGRLVIEPVPIVAAEGTLNCAAGGLSPGLYFAVIRSCGRAASVKFLLLPRSGP